VPDRPAQSGPRRATFLLYGGGAAVIVGIHLATNGVLGFHIDELYYLACGRHLAFGYVDFPPVVPLLARLETGLLGVTPWTLRLLPALLGGVNVILAGAYVRKLGGSLKLQAVALLLGITAPAILGTWLFQTVIFDQVTWMVALYLFLSLVIDPKPRTWILLGITFGVGLEVKYTIVALIAGVCVAVVLTPALRGQLRTRYPWIAVCLALLIWVPNLAWQVANSFPSLAYLLNHQGSIGSGGGPGAFLLGFLVLLLLLAPLWIVGLLSLFRSPNLRPIGIACAVPIVLFLFVGKYYYPAPTIPVVIAAGVLTLSRVKRPKVRTSLSGALVLASLLGFVAVLKIAVPTTPPDRLHATGLDTSEPDLADTVGWEAITQQLTATYGALPSSERATTVIISADYGVTGALDIYGNPKLLPASYSPQLSDYLWVPRHVSATLALMVGYEPSDVAWMCTSAKVITRLTVPYNVVNLEQGTPVTLCNLKEPLPKAWSGLKNFS
jgi:Dolichyl-phosphate-mannose-protein mannosyltransferase